ncbi:hypothetical protein ACLOJK_008308 [Asimina triloba]
MERNSSKFVHGTLEASIFHATTNDPTFPCSDALQFMRRSDKPAYVTIKLNETRVAKTTEEIDRAWNQSFQILCAHAAESTTIVITLRTRRSILGRIHIPALQLLTDHQPAIHDGFFPLSNEKGKPIPKLKLRFRLQFNHAELDPWWGRGLGHGCFPGITTGVTFHQRSNCSVNLYQDAHHRPCFQPPICGEGGEKIYKARKLWEDVYRALDGAKHLIYIAGWSLNPNIVLVRDPETEIPNGVGRTIGELLKRKAEEGVAVRLMLWDDETSLPIINNPGVMRTHNRDAHRYFNHSNVVCCLCPRTHHKFPTFFTHHQKTITVDTPTGAGGREITSFLGGFDLCDGRYDTEQHALFRTLNTPSHAYDFYQINFAGASLQRGGPREPWHDAHARVTGQAAWDVLANFEQRWNKQLDPALLPPAHKIPNLSHPSPTSGDWNVQVFRSIDHISAASSSHDLVECSIHAAYVAAIRRAERFIYIENQYFMGGCHMWEEDRRCGCGNLVPVEIAMKVASKIRAGERFGVYMVVPMWPEGVPDSEVVQEMLHWTRMTMATMYGLVGEAIRESGKVGAQPRDYLNFFCLGNREKVEEGELVPPCSPPHSSSHWRAQHHRRFMVYVHSKLMIVRGLIRYSWMDAARGATWAGFNPNSARRTRKKAAHFGISPCSRPRRCLACASPPPAAVPVPAPRCRPCFFLFLPPSSSVPASPAAPATPFLPPSSSLPLGELSILDLPDLVLECILGKLSLVGLCSMAAVCRSLRERCWSNHLWERHMREKWSRAVGPAAHREWSKFDWGRKPKSSLPVDSMMSWYLALHSGKFWFPAQVYNREESLPEESSFGLFDGDQSYETADRNNNQQWIRAAASSRGRLRRRLQPKAAPIYEEVKMIKDHIQIDGVMKDKVGERRDLKEIAVDFDEIEEKATSIYEEVKTIKDHIQIDGVMKDKVGERRDLKEIARSFWVRDFGNGVARRSGARMTPSMVQSPSRRRRGCRSEGRWEMDAEDGRMEERGGGLRLRAAMGDRELGRRKMEDGREARGGEEAGGGERGRVEKKEEEVGGGGRSDEGRLDAADPVMGGWRWDDGWDRVQPGTGQGRCSDGWARRAEADDGWRGRRSLEVEAGGGRTGGRGRQLPLAGEKRFGGDVDDEYILIGSANVNQRSMDGRRDTEIAIGCYQPDFTGRKRSTSGEIHRYRMSLWYEHTRLAEEVFREPESVECVRRMVEIGDKMWSLYSEEDEVVDMEGVHLVSYPMKVTREGRIEEVEGGNFPDTTALVRGKRFKVLPAIFTA